MVEQILQGCRVLIVEDEYDLADELRIELRNVGATVIGPIGHLAGAIALVQSEPRIDVAVLDVNLRGEAVFPVADLLADRGVPIVFATGYDVLSIAPRYAHIVTCVKPVKLSAVIDAVERAAHS